MVDYIPHLEYCNQAWHPHFQKHRSNLENAQRRATRLIPSLASLPYEQRLMKLDLPTLDFRRKRGRMIEVYKILNGVYDKRVTRGMLMENDRITRGNQRKLVVQPSRTSTRGNFFTVRAANDWNSLPDDVTSAGTLDVFKAKLDNTWRNLNDDGRGTQTAMSQSPKDSALDCETSILFYYVDLQNFQLCSYFVNRNWHFSSACVF